MTILDQFGEPWLDPLKLPEIDLNISVQAFQSKPRKIKMKWSTQAADDLRDMCFGRDCPEPSAIDRLGAVTYSAHRDTARHIAGLPDDLIPADVKDMALGVILDLIPQEFWPSARTSSALDWDESVIGIISKVIQDRSGLSARGG